MLQLSHRGLGTDHPENSIAAFTAALDGGLDGLEVDVRRCKSGEVVVIHDASVSRVTRGAGQVSNMSYQELNQLYLSDGSLIPLLEDVIHLANKKLIDIELKDVASAEPVAQLIAKSRATKTSFIVSSKLPEALKSFRAADKKTPIGFISAWRPIPPTQLVKELDIQYMIWNSRLVTKWGVTAARKLDMKIFAYRVASPLIARLLAHHKIDGLIVDSDRPLPTSPRETRGF